MVSQSKEKFLQELSDISQELEKERKVYEHDNDTWWNGLSEAEREDAFYAVVKRICKSELKDKGSYRHALYDVFGFGPNMYTSGMDCGFMALHNAIFDGEELMSMKSINRFEVIDKTGRAYTKYLKDDERVRYQLQDENKTLKVFIDTVTVHKIRNDL
jgi:hypothetical protein